MKKFSILVIDDNVETCASLQEILTTNDFVVKTAGSGKSAFEMLGSELFDLIFIETSLREMDSFAICRMIKKNENFLDPSVLFIINPDNLNLIKDIYESEGDDYIQKPLICCELIAKARVLLELKYSRMMASNMNQMLEDKVAQRTFELEESLTNLKQAKKELEILEIAKSEFLNLISHEIRTPLNGILGSMALIGRYNLADEVNRYFSMLDTSVRRLEKFSNTILEASTLRIKGSKSLKFSQIDLVKVLQSATEQCKAKFQEKGIEIKLLDDTTNSLLKGDPQYLLKCFTAVLDNAFKFSPKGERVDIRVNNEANGYLKIIVTDRGKGFSKAALDNIYNALSNLEAHFDQNTGMGLHLAKLIVDAHSGFIKVGNLQPTGAFIEILIPLTH